MTSLRAASGATPARSTAELQGPRVGEYGYRGSGWWGYACSLCGKPFGPFRTEAAARKFADLHASECSHA